MPGNVGGRKKPVAANRPAASLPRAPSGIAGFDAMTGGGLPRARTTLLVGGPGSGKTVLALQFLVHGARQCNEPGIFVAFEESAGRIAANMETFGWGLDELQPDKLFILDAQPSTDLVRSGNFDLGGMLAALDAQTRSMRARRIAFDALDIVLALLPDENARRLEVRRLHEWLLARQLTGVLTSKAVSDAADTGHSGAFDFMQFMVDCAVTLNHRVVFGISQRNLRVMKYRGTAFDENESAFVIGAAGFEVALARPAGSPENKVTHERVSTGIARLDTMLTGGYFRGASVLITGSPGTAKSTLSGAFAEAACQRGERTLFVSFDSDSAEMIRNLSSVGIAVGRFVKNGLLRIVSGRAITGSAETFFAGVKMLCHAHGARCMVIDPISALSQVGNELTAHGAVERLLDWCRASRITLVCTSTIEATTHRSSPMEISTIVDTWLQLSYLVQAGERNRSLSIVKSRGTAHSSQVREVVLSPAGVTLSDAYTAGGEVLMGTLRWQKENAERGTAAFKEAAARLDRLRLDAQQAELEVRIKSLGVELAAKRAEKALLVRATRNSEGDVSRRRTRMQELRGADLTTPEPS